MTTTHPRGRVVLVRHGETDWSAARKHTGRTDLALNADGRAQAAALAPVVARLGVTRTFSSPLQRARDTALLAGLPAVEEDPQLQEWDYGAYEGLTTAEISEQLGRPWSVWDDGVAPGATPGESLTDVRTRVDDVVARVLPDVEAGDTVALVAHGHSLRVLATAWLDVDPKAGALLALGPATVSTLTFEHARRVVGVWSAAPHLLT